MEASATTTAAADASPSSPTLWSISVRTVGGGGGGASPSGSAPPSRTVSGVGTASATASSSTASTSAAPAAAAAAAGDENNTTSALTTLTTTPKAVALKAAADDSSAAPSSDTATGGTSGGGRNVIGTDGHYQPFTVQIDPNETMDVLHGKIFDATGLAVDRQRLIYRGKIISAGSTSGTGSITGTSTSSSATAATGVGGVVGGGDDGDGGRSLTSTPASSSSSATRISGDSSAAADASSAAASAAASTSDAVANADEDVGRDENLASADTGNDNNGSGGGGNSNINTSITSSDCDKNTNNNNYNNRDAPRIRDVAGLGDGQTIHLVPRPLSTPASASSRQGGGNTISGVGGGGARSSIGTTAASDALASAILGEGGSSTGSGGAALLAALLGLGAGLGGGGGGGGSGGGGGVNAGGDGTGSGQDGTDDDLAFEAGTVGGTSTATADLLGSGIGPILTGGGSTLTSAARTGRRSRREQNSASASRPSHVLTEEDLQERRDRDIGSLEPVRQGLMTAHTILHGAGLGDSGRDGESSSERSLRGLPPRRFYRGQWVDVLDTVNAWLEATIVDVATPEDVLGIRPSAHFSEIHHGEANPHRNRRGGVRGVVRREDEEEEESPRSDTQHGQPRGDPIVGANDWEGRRMLLLEPDPDADDVDPIEALRPYALEGQDLSSYRERPSNVENDVQLLLIHYNGWPRRWDEWIRSDSTRIRPFRSRTRHGAGAQVQSGRRQRQSLPDEVRVGACPSIRAAFHAAPSTYIRSRGPDTPLLTGDSLGGDEEMSERVAALSGLRTALRQVEGLITACVDEIGENGGPMAESNLVVSSAPLEIDRRASTTDEDEIVDGDGEDSSVEEFFGDDDLFVHGEVDDRARYLPWQAEDVAAADAKQDGDIAGVLPSLSAARRLDPSIRLRTLAPLLDRVGRVSVSLAPHVAALAEKCPQNRSGIGNASVDFLERGDGMEDAVMTISPDGGVANGEEEEDIAREEGGGVGGAVADSEDEAPSEDAATMGDIPPPPGRNVDGVEGSAEDSASIGAALRPSGPNWWIAEPDMSDFVNAAVNETPSVENGPARGPRGRSRGRSSLSDDLTSALLAAALAGSAGGTGATTSNDVGDGQTAGAAAGPRVINLGGDGASGGGGGIDIHVHMLVTGPGMPSPTAFGRVGTNFGGEGQAVSIDANAAENQTTTLNRQESPASVSDDDEDDLFSELYTETPQPAAWSSPRPFADDSSESPTMFADYSAAGDSDADDSPGSEHQSLSEIESDVESCTSAVEEAVPENNNNIPPSPLSPQTTPSFPSGPGGSSSSPRRSPLSRLLRRVRGRR